MNMAKKLVAGLVAIAMLAGCGSRNSSSTDTFRWGSELDIQGMDSTVVDDGMSFTALHAITEGLQSIDKDGKVTEGIAKSYTISDDQKTYTFTLRDAKWSNGDAVKAQDFVYSWKRIIKEAGNYSYMMGSEGAKIKNADALIEKGTNATDEEMNTLGVTAKDDKTLVVELETPVPYLLELMTFPCYYPQNEKFIKSCGVDKNGKSRYATEAKYTVSNGAYTMTGWTKGKSATFEKNDSYYAKDSIKTKTISMQLAMDSKTAAANFDSNKLDFAVISSALVDKYKNSKEFTTYSEGYLFYLELNFQNKYLANANIRKALSLAINRKDLADTVLKDGSTEANGFIPSGLSSNSEGKDFREAAEDFTKYSLTEAQAAFDQGMKELGVTSVDLELLYGTDESPMDKFAEYLQSNFAKIKGLNISMKATVKKDRIYNKEAKGEFDIACTRWGPDYSDPTTYLNLNLSNNQNNYGKYVSETYDNLMKQVQNETDATKRFNLMIEAEKVSMNDYSKIPVFQKNGAGLKKSNVSGMVIKPVGVPFTFNFVNLK